MRKILVILTTVALVGAFALTAAASDFSFYGSLRYNTISEDIGPLETVAHETPGYEAEQSDRDTSWGLWGHSRLGAKITLSDEITGLFELGAGDEALSLRHYYAEYDFGGGKMLIGQTWHPSALIAAYSGQTGWVDDGLGSHGAYYGGRREMIKLAFGDFQLYFIEPRPENSEFNSDLDDLVFGVESPANADYDETFPQIAASYGFSYENLSFDGMIAYQTYEFTDLDEERSYDIDSWFYKLGASVNLGQFTFSGSYGWGENLGNMGITALANADATPIAAYDDDPATAGIYDIDTTGFTLVASLKVNDILSFETGYGSLDNDLDHPEKDASSEAYSYYLQANIKIADGFSLTPEIGKMDYQNLKAVNPTNGLRETYTGGDMTYFGAKWQIDF